METTTAPAYLSIRELADYLRISERTAYDLVTREEIPSVRVGGQHRIPRNELERQLARRTRGTEGP
jgi:excisionase family DNA binding protein